MIFKLYCAYRNHGVTPRKKKQQQQQNKPKQQQHIIAPVYIAGGNAIS